MDIKCFRIAPPPTFLVPSRVNTLSYYGIVTHKQWKGNLQPCLPPCSFTEEALHSFVCFPLES